MRVIDADGHVRVPTDDKYLDPAFRDRRPAIVGREGCTWMIGEQVFPRRSGLGCNNFSTPARIDGKPTRHGALIEGRNLDSLDSQELTDLNPASKRWTPRTSTSRSSIRRSSWPIR